MAAATWFGAVKGGFGSRLSKQPTPTASYATPTPSTGRRASRFRTPLMPSPTAMTPTDASNLRHLRKIEMVAKYFAVTAHMQNRLFRVRTRRQFARIAEKSGISRQGDESVPIHNRPEPIHAAQSEKGVEVMRFRNRKLHLLKKRLQVLLDALLGMITNRSRRRMLAHSAFAFGHGGILLGPCHPFKRDVACAHTVASRF